MLITSVAKGVARRRSPDNIKAPDRIRIPILPLKDITANRRISQVQAHDFKPERARNIPH